MQDKTLGALPDLNAQQRQTLTLIYELYYGQMYKKAYAVLRNKQDAEDAVQEAFYRVCLNAEVFAQPHSEATAALIYVYTRNEVINHYHKKKRRNAMIVDASDADALIDAEACDLELLMVQQENSAEVRHAVDALEPHYREVVILKYYHNKKNTEIAEILGIGQNVVNGRIFRAKKMLRKLLSEQRRNREGETD